jgi:hypothetical protein
MLNLHNMYSSLIFGDIIFFRFSSSMKTTENQTHLPDDLGRLQAASALVNGVRVDLLSQDNEGGLGGLTNLGSML